MQEQERTSSPAAECTVFEMSGRFESRSRGYYMDDGGPMSRGECRWPLCPGIPPRGALLCERYHILQDVTDPMFDVFIDAGIGWSLGTVGWDGAIYESLIFDLEAMKQKDRAIPNSD